LGRSGIIATRPAGGAGGQVYNRGLSEHEPTMTRPRYPHARLAAACLVAGAALAGMPVAAKAPAAGPAPAHTLRILSFNAEHLMSAQRFAQWRAFCSPLRWREPDSSRGTENAAARRPESLTYCDALDGTDGRGKRVFAPVRDEPAWRSKMDAVAALVRSADADVVLLQEVSDVEAARIVLGPQYRVATTAELWGGHEIAQNLAMGWRPASTLSAAAGATGVIGAAGGQVGSKDDHGPKLELVEAVSQAGPDGRRTRPGLALLMDLGAGRRVAILNVHLKAGCRQGRLDEATSRNPERSYRRREACAVFQHQVPALERWADDKLRQGFGVVIAGDFNRDLLREIREHMPARSDRTDAARPADPARIASLVAELSDEEPPAAWFALVRAGRYGKLADCHRRIDNFLLSRNMEPWLSLPFRQLSGTVIPFAELVSLDRPRPSDHCPHLLRIPLRGAR
jgi:endonuclease/exonuclease/phosphatase family metal-dependent hydrolase